jgi:hypothetical protein
MKSAILITSFLICNHLFAQIPRFAKYPILETGAALYTPGKPTWQHSFSEDSSDVYTMEIASDTAKLGAIVVRLKEDIGLDSALLNRLLWSYMDYLNQSSFKFASLVPPGYGHKMESHPNAHGILEYAKNADGAEYSLKGWIDGKFIAILYIGRNRTFNFNLEQMFLNGFRFPDK